MQYRYNDYNKYFSYGRNVILANIANGKWVRLSKEVQNIIEDLIHSSTDDEEIEYEDANDKEFLESVINDLKECEIIIGAGHKTEGYNKIASVELTHRCNLHCIHCCIDAQTNMSAELDMNFDNMLDILKKLVDWNPKAIMLSGGEPMLRRDFFQLAEYLRSNYNGNIILSTNGTLITKHNVNKLCTLVDKIDISLDGYNEETCSLIRGAGVFKKVIETVNLLKACDFNNISLSIATADKNESWEEEFKKLNDNLGTVPVFRMFSPVGRGENSKEFFTLKSEHEVYLPEKYLSDDESNIAKICCCSAGKKEIFIDYKGDVYPCPSYSDQTHKLGNLCDDHEVALLTKTYDSMQMVLEGLKKNGIEDERCKECCVSAFCWTCPGTVDNFKTKEALESQCKRLYPVLLKRVWGEIY